MTEEYEAEETELSDSPREVTTVNDSQSESELTFAEMMEFGEGRIENETAEFDGDIPNHAARMLTAYATDLLQTLTNIEIQRANEKASDPTDEQIESAVADDLVDILLAISAVKHEYDVDIVTAFEKNMEFVQDYRALEEVMEDAETQEDMIAAFEEHMGDHAEGNPMAQMMGSGGMGDPPVEPGDNVDDDEYDADNDRDRHIA